MVLLALLLVFGMAPLVVSAQEDATDLYVDLSFTCPVTTTCPQVCSPTYDDCPEELKCNNVNETLCADGSCAVFCDPSLTSPCEEISSCSPVTCASVNTYYDACFEDYGPWYEFAAMCPGFDFDDDAAAAGDVGKLSWTSPGYLAVYCWVSIITISILHWCWFNHRVCPVEGSMVSIDTKEEDGTTRKTTQTGYKRHPVGIILYLLTLLTFFGWFALLILCTHLYTISEGEDLLMSLRTFCVVWVTSFVWNVSLLWPYSIESLFLRRCKLMDATHVAIFHETIDRPDERTNEQQEERPKHHKCPSFIMAIVDAAQTFAWAYFTFIFADPQCRPDSSKGIFDICPVQCNVDGSRYLVFLFRRYNFQKITDTFEPGYWAMGKTFQDLSPRGISTIEQAEWALERIMLMDDNSESLGMGDQPIHPRWHGKGLSDKDVQERFRAVGPNIMEVPPPSLFKTFSTEIAKPFYIYQVYIVWIWICIDYLYATVCVWLMVLMTAFIISWFRYRGAQVLYAISHVSDQPSSVLRNGRLELVQQTELVPGDIVQIDAGKINCDMVLLTGECLVDESALTGEATPQAKSPIDPHSRQVYDPAVHKKVTLSAGTTILECEEALALVMKTASNTTKGELMRDVLIFRKHTLKFRTELPIVVSMLATYSTLFFLIVLFTSGDEAIVSWFLGMTAFSNAFPPLLPTTFIIPVGFAFERLARQGVACSNSDSILIASQVNVAFFDKTGTLTKQGLDYVSARSADSWTCGQWTSDTMALAMCVCHSLTKSKLGTLIGNPVDRAMFEASAGVLVEASGVTAKVKSKSGETFDVLRRFDFDHIRMTQSVIVRKPGGTISVIVKGSGEKLSMLCDPDTVPDTFEDRLRQYSRTGVYQIAVGTKDLDTQNRVEIASLSRDEVERDLEFAGVLNFANQLREDTPEVIKQLQEADVQSIMLTGDNLHTGIHIARKSGIMDKDKSVLLGVLNKEEDVVWMDEDDTEMDRPSIKDSAKELTVELSMSGEAWQVLLDTDKVYATEVAPFIRVFGRCSPLDKVSVVDTFTSLSFTTMMCGDGGNDCGALRAAHIGLALSDSDASVVAPLTSLNKDIADVLKVFKEGRGSMASTMAAYKYVILYGNISSYCQLIMYYLNVSFSDWMWFFTDVLWTMSFTLTLPLSKPAPKLSKAQPTSSILSLQTVGGVVGVIAMNYIYTLIAFAVLYSEDWYQCRKWESDIQAGSILSASDNYETSVLFLMVGIQLMAAAASLNFGYEYRQAWWRNYVFAALAIGFITIHTVITLHPGNLSCLWRINCDNEHVVRGVLDSEPAPIGNPYNSTIMPNSFRFKMLGIMLANFVSVVLYEYFVVNGLWQQRRLSSKQLAMPAAKGDLGRTAATAV
ncbi:Probable cation-transporting ATPase 13A4 [Seminavis robusta]|uniref:Probable cation-transporting ATPase 13A4 n=1 Tax=Seminavis robusta TaxID=568900 RepID=A0A9N8ERG0_9STRA|nr:Probable cation-transporting ATPase 13A4 [Seminavis robusta]|eukprot:Sro1404_g269720.1 Probable cation-transporting ATPase 13A4 (1375) ;mRNA; f:18157-22464